MTLGPLGPPPGAPPAAGYCARCGRRIGSYLAYAAGQAPEPGAPPGERICYRCHRLATRGRLPPSLPDAHGTGRAGVSQFVLYRLGMIFLALCTLFVLRRTGEGAPFFYGLGGIILLYTDLEFKVARATSQDVTEFSLCCGPIMDKDLLGHINLRTPRPTQ